MVFVRQRWPARPSRECVGQDGRRGQDFTQPLESVSGTFQSGTYECKPHFPMKEKQKTNPENGGIIRF